jgi:nitroimidazol reductase NimA-like FMN-containing flavoprotein (pyridoxamine 5'-phosphate oxidase superfamily)/predicted N-acetyltransferase YhbS
MRRREFRSDREHALAFLRRADVVRLATSTPDGEPVLRALNAVVVDEHLMFHGAKAGEKALTVGRAAVAAADEVIASIPSYFVDPELACPATTFYESVQVKGRIELIEDAERKARMLSALMQKYQPEGGYQPIEAQSALYAGAVRGVLVFGLPLTELTGKLKVGQNRKPDELRDIVERLWARGAPTDARAIQRLFAANPDLQRPARFIALGDVLLEPALDESAVEAAVELLAEEYWNLGQPRERLRRAHLASTAWVGARTSTGELVATARATSDGAKQALLLDVAVQRSFRGRGLGRALVELLLDHPALRGVYLVRLGTADAQEFYRRFGFVESSRVDLGFTATAMTLVRGGVVPEPGATSPRTP